MNKCCFLACFCASHRIQRRKAEITLAQIREKATKRLGRLAPNLAHVQIHMGLDIRQTNCSSIHKGALGRFRGGGQQFISMGKLTDWHQIWFTSADSSGNGHELNTSRPSIPQGHWGGGGVGCDKSKSLGKLSNGWTDCHQMCHTSADPSGNGYTPNKLPFESQGHLGGGGFRGKTFKSLGKLQTAGPIGTNFGSRLRIHLGMDIG